MLNAAGGFHSGLLVLNRFQPFHSQTNQWLCIYNRSLNVSHLHHRSLFRQRFASSILPLSASESYLLQLVMSTTTGISNVQSVDVKDSIFSTVSGIQINHYNARAALDASKLRCTPYHVPVRD